MPTLTWGFFDAFYITVFYNKNMKYTLREFEEKFRSLIGDGTVDIPERFIIDALNWSFNELPRVPKLAKLFSKHIKGTLDAKGHYEFRLNEDFRRILNIPMINFWSSTGGEPCRLKVCHRDVVEFYNKNGLVELKVPGTPCEYTIEQEDDDIKLVFDRPLDVPVIVDYIAQGIPKMVKSMDDVVEISAIAENLILDVMRTVYYHESEDFAFAADISSYLDNKKVVEAIQALNRRWDIDEYTIVGEA